MSLKPAKVQFNGGELSPWLEARTDINKFDKTARLCRNFIPLAEGSLKRRGGTRFIALTPEEEEVFFKINAIPMEAEIIINGIKVNSVNVARGDYISYEVKAVGYVGQIGKKYITENTELDVELVSLIEMCRLTINPVPYDAVVKIEGYERNSGDFAKNSEVFYIVLKDGYIKKSGVVKMTNDIALDVVLDVDIDVGYDGVYGDWGKPEAFISCSAVGNFNVQKKCILLRFDNGYLPIVFSANKIAPDLNDVDESLFFYTDMDGADCIAEINGEYKLCNMKKIGDSLYYYDLFGKIVMAIDELSQKVLGWQGDEDGNYATYYKTYNGTVSGKIIKVYYKDEAIFVLDGRD